MQRIFIPIPKTHWIIYHEIHSMLSVISVIILNALQVVISSKNKHGCFCPAKGMSQTSLSKLVSKRIQMRRISCFFFFIPATGTFKFGNSLRFNFTEWYPFLWESALCFRIIWIYLMLFWVRSFLHRSFNDVGLWWRRWFCYSSTYHISFHCHTALICVFISF